MSEFIPYTDIDTANQRSADFWAGVRGPGWQPGNVTQYLYTRRQRTGDPEADADLPAGVDFAIQVNERDADLDTVIADDVAEPHEGAAVAALYPNWDSGGVSYAVGDILNYGDELYKVRQVHTSQIDWAPDGVPSLFIRWRANADTLLPWIAWEQVIVGYQRTYSGGTYECIQTHVTEFTPDVTPALWSVVSEPTAEWQAGVAYSVNDVVTYQGAEYECRQSHTSQVGWEPPNVLALWLPL